VEDMHPKSLMTAIDMVLGNHVSDEDKEYLKVRTEKYELVRSSYLESAKTTKPNLVDFDFSPGPGFMEADVGDVVNELLVWDRGIEDGSIKCTLLTFSDRRLKDV